jgi:hypothetical protein
MEKLSKWNCISQKVMKLCIWQLFNLKLFRASKKQFIIGVVQYEENENECGFMWECGAVFEVVTCEEGGCEFESCQPHSAAILYEKWHNLFCAQ